MEDNSNEEIVSNSEDNSVEESIVEESTIEETEENVEEISEELEETELPSFDGTPTENEQTTEDDRDAKIRELEEKLNSRDGSSELVDMIKQEKLDAINAKKEKEQAELYQMADVKYPADTYGMTGKELKSIIDANLRNATIAIYSAFAKEMDVMRGDINYLSKATGKLVESKNLSGMSYKDTLAINEYIKKEGLGGVPNGVRIAKKMLGITKGSKAVNKRYISDEYNGKSGSIRQSKSVSANKSNRNEKRSVDDINGDIVIAEMRKKGIID